MLAIKHWSIGQQFADFARGVLTLSGLTYFVITVVVMLYVSMVLIGRRHWFSGRGRWIQAAHYTVRTLILVVAALGVVIVFQNHDLRLDVTSARLNSLSYQTRELIRDLKVTRPVQIEAFISPNVPESYVQTRLNLLTMLRELQALGGEKVQVQIHDTERFSNEAALADKRYGIEPRQVSTLNHGALSMDQIFLHVAMSCGVQKVPPVFFDRGIPIEYELVRSICTVSQQKRKKLGVLNTDAQLYGSFNMQTMSPSSNWPIIDELEKQYDVVKVDPRKPITEQYDALLAVQPSSLGPQEMDNFVAAVAGGQPTAIFEDPAPVFGAGVPATSMPRQPPGGMNPMFGGMQAPPKGDITKLWHLLGVDFVSDQIIWQIYNPYPKASHFPPEFVFVDKGSGAKEPFNPHEPDHFRAATVAVPLPGRDGEAEHLEPDLHPAGADRREDRHGRLPRDHADGALRTARRTEPQPAVDTDQSVLRPGRPYPGQGADRAAGRGGARRRTRRARRRSRASRSSTPWWCATSTCSPRTSSASASRATCPRSASTSISTTSPSC